MLLGSNVRLSALAASHPLQGDAYRLLNHYARDIDPHVEDGSVDAIITDPPYSLEYIDCYHALAELAPRELKPGGHLLVMVGQLNLPEIIAALNQPPLVYRWTLNYRMGGPRASIVKAKVWTNWKPILWFTNGPSDWDYVNDDVNSSGRDRTLHEWQQNADGFVHLVERFTVPGALVLDPFCGSGTTGAACLQTGRLFIGSDRDAAAIAVSAQRLSNLEPANDCHLPHRSPVPTPDAAGNAAGGRVA